jgi:CubicO group peptidase (beta-lactamase class C family)
MKLFPVGVAGGLLILTGVPAESPHSVPAATPASARRVDATCPDIGAKADSFLQAYERLGWFSGVALVVKDGRILFRRAYGKADASKGTDIQPGTRFSIGSITKQFTAVAILQLRERGKLGLDDPISKWFPQLPSADSITVRELLNQTSGLPDLLWFDEAESSVIFHSPKPLDELLRVLRTKPLGFAPGTKYEYSNTNYALLGAIIEAESAKDKGGSWEEYVQRNLLDKAGMKETGVFRPKNADERFAKGYGFDRDAHLQELDSPDHSALPGYGSLYSTADDLYRWDRALYYDGKLLGPKSLEEMTKITDVSEGYGLGVQVGSFEGRRIVSHGGMVEGFVSQLYDFVDDDAAIVLLCNNEGDPDEQIADGLAEILFCRPATPPVARQELAGVSLPTLRKYVGTYRLPGRGLARVKLEGGKLYLETSDSEFGVFPESATRLFSKINDDLFEFKFRAGKTTGFVWKSQGESQFARKISGG